VKKAHVGVVPGLHELLKNSQVKKLWVKKVT
jgi:hypothetical protein